MQHSSRSSPFSPQTLLDGQEETNGPILVAMGFRADWPHRVLAEYEIRQLLNRRFCLLWVSAAYIPVLANGSLCQVRSLPRQLTLSAVIWSFGSSLNWSGWFSHSAESLWHESVPLRLFSVSNTAVENAFTTERKHGCTVTMRHKAENHRGTIFCHSPSEHLSLK